ncbi:MAG: lytic murein transglycosylase [Solirubrobacteraceae bacterium]
MRRTGKRLRVALLTTLVSLTAMAAVATPASADRTIVVVMKATDAGQPASARTLTFTIGDRDATDPGAVAARFGLQADQIASVSVLAPPTQPTSPPDGNKKGDRSQGGGPESQPEPAGGKREKPARQRTTGDRRRSGSPNRRKAAVRKRGSRRHAARTHKRKAGAKRAPGAAAPAPVPAPGGGVDLSFPGSPLGVPNLLIDRFRVPPFLLPIYQAAGIQYGIPWQVLAAINEIETDYGRNLSVSSAGALGWMQFMPGTWATYGVDANGDRKRDPYNPVDAIFAAARYLKAAGGQRDLRKAIFAYNHAGWYVDSVILRARLLSGLPDDLVGALTGLTQGHFPVAAPATYADRVDPATASRRVRASGNAAIPVQGSAERRSIAIETREGAPVVTVNDGRIVAVGNDERLGRYVTMQDVYGNTYTYAHLGSVVERYPVPREKRVSQASVKRELRLANAREPKPTGPASAGSQRAPKPRAAARGRSAAGASAPRARARRSAPAAPPAKERLFAHPNRPRAYGAGGDRQLEAQGGGPANSLDDYFTVPVQLKRSEVVMRRLRKGSTVIAGTIIGRVGAAQGNSKPRMIFSIRPAGKGAPLIDPKPILDGWKLLEATAIYRAAGRNPFFGSNGQTPSIGQILLMSKEALARRVLADPRISIYSCGRRDIRAGVIDRRILATLEFLVASGMNPTVTSLNCGHSYLTKSGNVSEHSSGDAVDIAAINGVPILGHQGRGSITDLAVRRLLTLQGTMKPHQIITLMTYPGTDNTLSLPDHNDHIHVGFRPQFGGNAKLGRQLRAILRPGQWTKLVDRLGQIPNPNVPLRPSKYALPARGRSSD